jgi:L-amino acid N-acyltransferase YncA
MSAEIVIASATPADAQAIAAIYAHHVLHGVASWEMTPPSAGEFGERMDKVMGQGWPWLVARDAAGETLGYAYAAQFNPRAGYLYTCEDSIYLRHDARGRGIGTRLLKALIAAAEACHFRQMIAGIAGSEPASIALHKRLGFIQVAHIPSAGRKHGQWLDLVYMQRALGEGDASPPPEEPQ